MTKKPEPPRRPTRKELSRIERERRLQRRVRIGAALLAAAIIFTLVGGFVWERMIKPNQPVATVNATEISRQEYRKRVTYERFKIVEQMRQIEAQMPAATQNQSAGFLVQLYTQQIQQLTQQYQNIDFETLETMINEVLIQEKAAEVGRTVTEAEVQARIERNMARRAGAITQADLDATATASVNATATAAAWTPTPTSSPSPSPTVPITATETITAAVTITATPALSPTQPPPPTPTPNVLTEETFATTYEAYLTTLEQEVGFTEADYRRVVRNQLLREEVQQYFADQVPTEAEQVKVRAILFPTEEAAQTALAQLQAGDDMETVATEWARQHAGDLGWVTRGQTVPAFEEVAFSLEIGATSEPVETQFGWHVLQVTDRDEDADMVRVRHILVADEETANEVKQKLEAGGDFAELAREYSTDTTSVEGQGVIDLGWLTRDEQNLPQELTEAAFTLAQGAYSEPLPLGDRRFAIIQVEEGPAVRELDSATLQSRQRAAFEEWLNQAKTEAAIERTFDQEDIPPDPFADEVRQILGRFAGLGASGTTGQ